MKTLERTAKFFGIVSVRQNGNQVRITGIDGTIMRKHLSLLFETDQIAKLMFTSITDTAMIIHQFFIPDFLYMLRAFKESPKCRWAARRTVDKIIAGIMKNTWYKITTDPYVPMVDLKKMNALKWKPLPKQTEFVHSYGDILPKYDLKGLIIAMQPGLGKAQPLTSLVRTSYGWDTMANIKVGTKIVCPDGTLAPVIGVYPQGKKETYQLFLEDRRTTRSCKEHLWEVSCDKGRTKQILTLQNIVESDKKFSIRVCDPNFLYPQWIEISSIDYYDLELCQCIEVDHPDHLYITDDFIVTHNTFSDIMLATCVIPDSIAEVKIIISPKKALHLVWEKTIKEVFKKPVSSWVCDSGIKMPLDKTEYYVFNFEALDKAIELGKHLLSKNVRYFTIVDESHNFADYRSNRTQKLVKLQTLHKDLYFIWTSGSPILKSAAELSSFLKCSDPRYDEDADRRFRRIFTVAPGRANQIFNHRLGQMMAFFATKERPNEEKPIIKELPVKLPPSIANQFLISTVRQEMKEFVKKRLEFYKDNIDEYKRIVNKWMDYHETKLTTREDRRAFAEYQQNLNILMRTPDLMLSDLMASTRTYERTKLFPSLPPTQRRIFRNALSAVKNIKLKVRGEALGTVLAKRRSECAAMLGLYCKPDEIMKESLSKTLFFASSILPIRVLEKKLTGMGFEPMVVFADTNSQLTQIIDRFDHDPDANPICATMQSLSEAVPVTSASTVVLLNRPFRHAQWEQVVARADRLGQKHRVTVIEVTLDTGDEPNVSSTTDAILATVRDLINDIVGPAFSGPEPSERIYADVIDASRKDPVVLTADSKLDL